MDCGKTPGMLPVEVALQRMQAQVSAVSEQETVELVAALDRVLAEAVHADADIPRHDNSAMDGYALCLASDSNTESSIESVRPTHWLQVGEALAGHPFAGELKPGQCIRIMTGADIPSGATTVVMQENTSRLDGDQGLIEVTSPMRVGDNIRLRGEDMRVGDCLLNAGQRLGPVDLGILATLGRARVRVFRRLCVALVTTGDELIEPGQALAQGQLYDSNRYVLLAMLQRLAVDVVDLGIVPDNLERLQAVFAGLAGRVDALISSGGVSVGDADYTRAALLASGQVNFWKVAMKPGKPFAFGHLGDVVFFGLPGNPVSAVVTCHQLALPVLRQMAGEQVPALPSLQLVSAERLKKTPGRSDFQRGALVVEQGQTVYRSVGAQGSGLLTSLSRANAYAVLSREQGPVAAGETVSVQPFDRYLT